MAVDLAAVSIFDELDRLKWKYEPTGDDEIKCRCPKHDDSTPSASINTDKKVWHCHTCKTRGDFVTFLAYANNVDRKTILVDLGNRYDLDEIKAISPDTVEKYHAAIENAGPFLKELRNRGVTDEMIRAARLGYFDGRITIPIYDSADRCVNIRRYQPGAPTERKMRNTTGYGKVRIYRVNDIKKYQSIWICGGEIKALVAGHMFSDNEKEVGAIATTGGEGSWNDVWSSMFVGKNVYVCMDIDDAGIKAARTIADKLYPFAAQVKIIKLPLDKDVHPKGDINDFIGREGGTVEDLIRLMADAEAHEPSVRVTQAPEKGTKKTTLDKACMPTNLGWRLEFEAMISASDTVPYLLPKEIDVECDKKQTNCSRCPVSKLKSYDGLTRIELESSSQGMLNLVNSPQSLQTRLLKEALSIPECDVVEFHTMSHRQVIDVRLAPQMHVSADGIGDVRQPAFIVDANCDLNVPYIFSSRVYPHPKTQQAILVVDRAEETADSLASYAPTQEEMHQLEAFRAPHSSIDDVVGLQQKIDEIYTDIEGNVTKIYQRRDMHLLMDLVYHSVLYFDFDGRKTNGWVNALVIGDSAQGKSEASSQLMKHYRLGERVDCKNATVPGLLGGVQQMGNNRWFVSWGAIPMHDQRLVILEELKGAATEVISKLTDMRSSGVAEIPKIERRKAHARTRLLALTNARSDRPMSSFAFGIEAIHEVVGSPEDVRRFDVAIVVASGRVDTNAIARKQVEVPVTYHGDLCRRLVLWGWTLKPERVVFTEEAHDCVYEQAKYLCEKYSEEAPLIDRGTAKHKLARLAVALAVRTFSEHDGKCIVEPRHVLYISQMLERMYDDPAMGYGDFSRAKYELNTIVNPGLVVRFIKNDVKHPFDIVRGMLYRDEIVLGDMQDFAEVEREPANRIISFFVRNHCLRRTGQRNGYAKLPAFIRLLKELEYELASNPRGNSPEIEEEL